MRPIALTLALFLAGCSTTWGHRDGHDEERWSRDVSECEHRRLSVMPANNNLIGIAMANENFERCMVGKGYQEAVTCDCDCASA